MLVFRVDLQAGKRTAGALISGFVIAVATIAASVTAIAGNSPLSSEKANAHPNVLVILADDLGWRDLSCFGSPFCETPHLDALAATGMRLTQAYSAASICSPTRASLMTGRHAVRTGVTDWIPGLKPKPGQMRTPRTAMQLALSEVTLGEMFGDAGFTTFYAGKWHLGGEGFEPTDQGFDRYVGDGQLGNHKKDHTVGQRIAQSFSDFVDQRDTARPFFAYLAFHEPHTPILEYPQHIEQFRRKARQLGSSPEPLKEHMGLTRPRQDDPAYGSEVAGLDQWVGQVISTLDRENLRNDTIVLFYSDNGGLSTKKAPGPTNNAPLRAGKGWLYEGGIRVPAIVSFPGRIEAGSQTSQLTVSHDIAPTLLELAGLEPRPKQAVDGRSIASVLLGNQQSLPQRAEYWHYPHYHGSTWAPGAAMRDGPWKLLHLEHFNQTQLFHLKDDPGELQDLALQYPQRVSSMLDRLQAWQRSIRAKFAVPKNLETEQLVAWCIVPFDAARRGPAERAKMLRELGLRRLAYDWREEHVPSWGEELRQLRQHDIELTAFWCSTSLTPADDARTQRIVDFLRKHRVQTQLWIMLPAGELEKLDSQPARAQAAAQAVRQLAEQVSSLGCSVGLYNHGGWIGEPKNMIETMQRLKDLDNVGIVYNFHHAHDDLDEFPAALEGMKPYLMCVNLNGTTVAGPKIQTIGEGTLDREIIGWLRRVHYNGPIGILDHRDELDAKESLQQNIDGLRELTDPASGN